MSSAGRSRDRKPASPDSARLDEGVPSDPASGHERGRTAPDGQAATTTAVVVSPSITSTGSATQEPPGRRFGTPRRKRGGTGPDEDEVSPDKPVGGVRRV